MTTAPLEPLLEALATTRRQARAGSPFRLGTVTATAGGVAVRFDGETQASGRTYTRLSAYAPTIGDRVLLGRAGSTWVILGKVTT